MRRRRLVTSAGGAALVFAVSMARGLCADAVTAADVENLTQSAQVERDRDSEAILAAARDHLAHGEFAEAIDWLGRLLAAPDDGFLADGLRYRSIKSEANRLISELPPAGIAAYRKQVEPAAARALSTARRTGHVEPMIDVAVQYRNTRAGLAAMRALAARHFDRGQFLAAAAAYRGVIEHRLANGVGDAATVAKLIVCWVRSGQVDRAREWLARHQARLESASVRVAGRRWMLGKWLRAQMMPPATHRQTNWRLDRGRLNRNGIAAAKLPSMQPVWRRNTGPSGKMAGLFNRASAEGPPQWLLIVRSLAEMEDQGIAPLTSFMPLIVNDVVVTKTVQHLLAVDLKSGQTLWRKPVGSQLARVADNPTRLLNSGFSRMFTAAVVKRIQADSNTGTLSSDGVRVFFVEERDPLRRESYAAATSLNGVVEALSAVDPIPENRLKACAVKSGEEQWQWDGPSAAVLAKSNPHAGSNPHAKSDPHAGSNPHAGSKPFRGVFFFGPPLPLDGSLYLVAQVGTDIRLLVVGAATGRLRWWLSLCHMAGRSSLSASTRRHSLACPIAYGDGLLICPTAAGAVLPSIW